ncbi:MAG: pyridoxine 5'-phosphate synthase [Bacteroidales bacterium]|jgi:pyridoxine 5-phosphate synthase|nr:pyridoxine 5'-phosphate synthase [Bacteroidales bacterium]
MACKLSVNINKIATLRNARGGNMPDVIEVAKDCQRFGAQGITVHPRPDQRHIRYDDVEQLKNVITTELNIEGYPSKTFIELVEKTQPAQVTLVPDAPEAITSNAGWNTKQNESFLRELAQHFQSLNIRTSIFVDADISMVEHAQKTGCQRIELYTENYARIYPTQPQDAISAYILAAQKAEQLGIELNAGHDLNLLNLHYFASQIPTLKEVSIGHALICDALYYGLENTIQMYLKCLKINEKV